MNEFTLIGKIVSVSPDNGEYSVTGRVERAENGWLALDTTWRLASKPKFDPVTWVNLHNVFSMAVTEPEAWE